MAQLCEPCRHVILLQGGKYFRLRSECVDLLADDRGVSSSQSDRGRLRILKKCAPLSEILLGRRERNTARRDAKLIAGLLQGVRNRDDVGRRVGRQGRLCPRTAGHGAKQYYPRVLE